jgi:SIR2-like domain
VDVTRDHIYSCVQGLFQRGLVIIIGSGASCALGLPGMAALAAHLLKCVPDRLSGMTSDCRNEWDRIAADIQAGMGLESALISSAIPDALSELIAESIAACIMEPERSAIAKILSDPSVSAVGRLFDHQLQTATVADVVTTNYDRLIEVHAARAGVRVDSMFYGHTIGRLDPVQSREELLRAETVPGRSRTIRVGPRPHIRLSKPHGSLDWFTHRGVHYRSDVPVPGTRRIVAPGGNKYRLGYEIPFDAHRARANDAIDNASALLFIGYGFNDDHLQTHIYDRLPQVPTVVLSRHLTEKAREYLALNSAAIGIEAAADGLRSRVTRGPDEFELDLPIWDLEHLVKEVLAK